MSDTDRPTPITFLEGLIRCPHDRHLRENAVYWYAAVETDAARCAWHLAKLARYHPNSLEISLIGRRLLIMRPALRRILERRLVHHLATTDHRSILLFNLGVIVSTGIPAIFGTQEQEHQWRKYFAIPLHYDLSSSWDSNSGPTAVSYLRQAMAELNADAESNRELVTVEVMRILDQLDRTTDIIDLGSQMLRPAPPDALIYLANALCKARRIVDAKIVFQEAIDEDARGYEQGGHASMISQLRLAEIALSDGDNATAEARLIAASEIEPCCHVTSNIVRRFIDALVTLGADRIAASYLRCVTARMPGLATTVNELRAKYGL